MPTVRTQVLETLARRVRHLEPTPRPVSPRVVHYSFDQLMAQPALDQIAVAADD